MTTPSWLLPAVLTATLVQGCAQDRFYAISGATPNDTAKTRRILREVAAQAGLPAGPSADKSLGDYATFNVGLHARIRDDQINVWLSRTDWPPPKAFRKADQLLAPAFSRVFGQRFAMSEISDIDEVTMF
jgi:hypothetical protein